MFDTEQFYEGKVFLRSYADAIDCIKQAAEKTENVNNYQRMMNRIIEAKNKEQINVKNETVSKGSKFKELKEYKLFQFTNFVFKKYFNDLDAYKGDFEGLRKILNDGHQKLKNDSH